MGKLILLRHGESTKREKGTIHRHQDESPLNRRGQEQSLAVSKILRAEKISAIYSSPERRAAETAEILSQQLNRPYSICVELEERNWGIYEGRSWSEVEAILKGLSLEQRYLYTPKRGESWKSMAERSGEFLKKKFWENPRETILAVTHVGVIRALIPFLTGRNLSESFKYNPEHGSLTTFDFDGINFKLL